MSDTMMNFVHVNLPLKMSLYLATKQVNGVDHVRHR